MRIAVIGAGNVGVALTKNLASAGRDVVVGTRDPMGPNATAARARLEAVPVTAIAEALTEAGVAILAVPGAAVDDLLATHGGALDGKIVIDAANRIGTSLGDRTVMNSLAPIAAAAPAAAVYRAFNSLGWENFADPVLDGVQADLLFAGPESHREVVERLIADVGLRPIHVGDLDGAPLVDALGGLWGALAFGQGMGRRLFFKVVTPG
jgi:predicted dinucleotide-binding enzyme